MQILLWPRARSLHWTFGSERQPPVPLQPTSSRPRSSTGHILLSWITEDPFFTDACLWSSMATPPDVVNTHICGFLRLRTYFVYPLGSVIHLGAEPVSCLDLNTNRYQQAPPGRPRDARSPGRLQDVQNMPKRSSQSTQTHQPRSLRKVPRHSLRRNKKSLASVLLSFLNTVSSPRTPS